MQKLNFSRSKLYIYSRNRWGVPTVLVSPPVDIFFPWWQGWSCKTNTPAQPLMQRLEGNKTIGNRIDPPWPVTWEPTGRRFQTVPGLYLESVSTATWIAICSLVLLFIHLYLFSFPSLLQLNSDPAANSQQSRSFFPVSPAWLSLLLSIQIPLHPYLFPNLGLHSLFEIAERSCIFNIFNHSATWTHMLRAKITVWCEMHDLKANTSN